VDRSQRDPRPDTKVSGMLSRLRSNWHQCRVFAFDYGAPAAGAGNFVYRFPLLFKRPLPLPRDTSGDTKNATMNRNLSTDEQREFWAQLFAVVVRYEARKRAASEVELELLEDARETETSQV
jgi:hypothetical protein